VPAVVVDLCHSSRSREFIRKVDATPDVKILTRCPSVSNAREYIMRHEAYGIFVIPNTFDWDILKGDQTYVGLYCDMSSMLYYKGLLLAATDVSLDMNRDIKVARLGTYTDRDKEVTKMPVEYDHQSIFNPQSGFASFLIPPVLMLIIQQTLLLGIGMHMGSTREEYMDCIIPFDKNYKNVMHIVTGKSLAYFMLYFIMAIYMFTFVNKMFNLPILGKYLVLIEFAIPYILACIFFAITLSSVIYRREDCILIFVFMSVPMLFLSGISWPSSAMPVFWKYFSYIFPSSFGMNAYVHIMNMGCELSDIRNIYIGIWVQVIFYFITSCLMYAKHLRKMKRMIF
jgi:ABC-2 type transport system permease protein